MLERVKDRNPFFFFPSLFLCLFFLEVEYAPRVCRRRRRFLIVFGFVLPRFLPFSLRRSRQPSQLPSLSSVFGCSLPRRRNLVPRLSPRNEEAPGTYHERPEPSLGSTETTSWCQPPKLVERTTKVGRHGCPSSGPPTPGPRDPRGVQDCVLSDRDSRSSHTLPAVLPRRPLRFNR